LGYDYSIIGAGPAGAAAAATLAKLGYKVAVYEVLGRPGLKPCGRGIPSLGDLPHPLPRESIVREIRGASLYVDGTHAVTLEGDFTGVIVDKSIMLESLIVGSGADLYVNAYYKSESGEVRLGGRYERVDRGLFAGGHGYYPGEKIMAVQYRLKSPVFEDMDRLEIWFDTNLVGYYYIFPSRGDEADVGVGGYADVHTLWGLLDKFIESREDLARARKLKREGASIAVGGLRLGSVNSLPKIGEAAGFVLPLTGEGIRPSMISGDAAAWALDDGHDPLKAQAETSIAKAVEVQRRILERVKTMERGERARLLLDIPAKVHAMIALGRIDKRAIILALARRPRLLARLLRLL